MPNEVKYSGPLTQPYACTLAGAQTSSHRGHFPAELEKRRGARFEVFSSPRPGSHSAFLLERDAVRRRSGERGVSMQGRESGPGYLTSLGTKPPLCAFRTLR